MPSTPPRCSSSRKAPVQKRSERFSTRPGLAIFASGGFALAGPGNNGIRTVHRCSVRQRKHRQLLLAADLLELGTRPRRADRERAALAEDDALVRDARLVERSMGATAAVRQEPWPSAPHVA